MTDNEIRIAIAEACGWKWIASYHGYEWALKGPNGCIVRCWDGERGFANTELPDYPNDLNAMRDAEGILNTQQQVHYGEILEAITKSHRHWKHVRFDLAHATARQRAEAFLRTLGKWKN